MSGKLNLLGLEKAPAKSTACDGMRNRDNKFFEDVYFSLVHHYQSFLSDSRTFGLTFKEVLLIDSTTIQLFSDQEFFERAGLDFIQHGCIRQGL